MQRMWRHLFAALAGMLAVVGAASAQTPGQVSIPQSQPSGVSRLNSIVAPAPIALAGGQTYVRGSGGCNGCGTPAPCAAPCAPARDCNNGCGSFKSDCNFVFGSCKSFFNACGPTGNGHFGGHGRCGGGLGGHHDRCGFWTFGSPYNTNGCNICVYDSFLNH